MSLDKNNHELEGLKRLAIVQHLRTSIEMRKIDVLIAEMELKVFEADLPATSDLAMKLETMKDGRRYLENLYQEEKKSLMWPRRSSF